MISSIMRGFIAPVVRSIFEGNGSGGGTPSNPNDTIISIDPSIVDGSPAGSFEFPLLDLGLNASIEIFWGDDTSDVITSTTDPALTHVYPDFAPRQAFMRPSGSSPWIWGFSTTGDRAKFIQVVQSGLASQTQVYNANVANFNGSTMRTNAYYVNSAIVTESAFMAWVKVEVGAISSPTIIGFNSAVNGHLLELRYQTIANVVACNMYNGGWAVGTSSPVSIEDGEYHLIGMNYSNGSFEFFVDGVSKGTGSLGTPTLSSSTRFTIADYGGLNGAGAYKGGMYRPEVYARNLTQEEWTFKASNPTKCRDLEIAEMPSLANAVYAPAFYNHAGFTGQEYIDQSGNGLTTTPSVTIPFTGSAQIECEVAP